MGDYVEPGPSPAEEDPVLHRYLADAAGFAPAPGLENRVLAWVRRPPPAWIAALRRTMDRYNASGQAWYVLGAFALGSLLPWIVLGAMATAEPQLLSAGARWVSTEGWPALAGAISVQAVGVGRDVGGVAGRLLPAGLSLTTISGLAAAVWLACAVALYRVMHPRRARGR
jgi:hypothetical protein